MWNQTYLQVGIIIWRFHLILYYTFIITFNGKRKMVNCINLQRISVSFILFVLHYIFCNILPWQSVSSCYCSYHSLSHSPTQQNFRQLFFSFLKVWGYPTSLLSWFINFKLSCINFLLPSTSVTSRHQKSFYVMEVNANQIMK